jgi:3-oxoacyl-[acyl-carrier protein] reductase
MTEVTTSDPVRLQERLKGIPLNRLGRPEDISGVALFLASPFAAYIVGETIVVDGGRTLS